MLQRLNLGTVGKIQEKNGRIKTRAGRNCKRKKKKGREKLISSRHELRRTELAAYNMEPKRADETENLKENHQDLENGHVWVEDQWRRRFIYDILTIQII